MRERVNNGKKTFLLTALLAIAICSGNGGAVADEIVTDITDMILINAGTYDMGFESGHEDELPVHEVILDPFYMDRHEVTNREFAEFIKATKYKTKAEKDGFCWGYLEGKENFEQISGANWRHPEGPESSIEARWDHPVVCVNWYDAVAYAKWANKRLPTEAEWEYAARAGTTEHFVATNDMNSAPDMANTHRQQIHQASAKTGGLHFGQDQSPSSKSHTAGSTGHAHNQSAVGETLIEANIWQGGWPAINKRADGYFYTAPAASYHANSWGLYDMIGNVWEWASDWYDENYYKYSPENNPTGPVEGEKRVARGGSWFCNPTYCGAYSTHYRGASPPERGFNNVGFRCAADIPVTIDTINKENQ